MRCSYSQMEVRPNNSAPTLLYCFPFLSSLIPSRAPNPITDSESGLDVDVSVLWKRGWRPTLETQYPEPQDPEAAQWISFRNTFWAKTSLNVSVGIVLDLSPWPDALQLLQLSSFKLLVRQEYADFYERLIDASKLSGSLRVITGSAGIGERFNTPINGRLSQDY